MKREILMWQRGWWSVVRTTFGTFEVRTEQGDDVRTVYATDTLVDAIRYASRQGV